jgi:MtrB/PioB family decaheme-associated outer membrane protein
MRTGPLTTIAAVLLCSSLAAAQTPQPQSAQPPGGAPAVPALGSIDFGGMFRDAEDDVARFERYRDTRDGLFSNVTLSRQTDEYLSDASAYHIGYRDQRYTAGYNNGRLKFSFLWDSIPLNYSYLTSTPFEVGDNGVLTLSAAARAAVQGPTNAANDGTAVGVPCAPGAPPAACSTPAAAADAKANRSIYNSLADRFDLQQKRDAANFGVTYAVNRELDVTGSFVTTKKSGEQPYGASFAFNNAVEVPLPIDHRTNDFSLGTTWANQKAMLRVAWDASFFDNHLQSLVWDNPIRLTDFNNGLAPPLGPYDASGYSNGNGPAQGRMSLAPDNHMNVLGVTGLYKLPRRTTVNGTFQFTTQSQNDELIPWTINSLINTPAVFALFPHLASLPRPTAEAKARGLNALLNLNSRPLRLMTVSVRYRYNDRDNQTPTFDATEYVRFDAVPEEIEEGLSHQYDVERQTLDANASFTLEGLGALRVGYGHDRYERHGRGFSDVGENIFRVSFDTFTRGFVSVRAGYDFGARRGEGFVETGIDYEQGPGGTQPTLRYYDESDRDRRRGSVVVTVMPTDRVDFYASFAGGKDEHLADDSTPTTRGNELFGLLDADVTSWNVGLNFTPYDTVSLGANYGRDRYSSLQRSRNANPPPDPTWTDPSRDWTLDNDDKVNNFTLWVDVLRAIRNTDIRAGYDYSDSNNSFVHGGPRIASLSAAGQFIPLPPIENQWHRLSADVKYFFTPRAGIGLGYYFETLDIADFAAIDQNGPIAFAGEAGDPRIDWLGGLVTGYGNRSYSGSNFFLRLLYLF